MNSIVNEISICPKCGCKLIDITTTSTNLYKLCPDSTCRTMIKDDFISEMDIDIYSRLQQKFNFEKTQDSNGIRAYMLLKENLSGPLLVKNSNKDLSSSKVAFCIVKANDKASAFKLFKQRFEVIKITPDMVVEVDIVENGTWK